MSFGYSVGDFFAVVTFAYNVYEKCRESTSQFKDLGRDVGNAHLVLRNIHRFWKYEEDRKRPLNISQQEELKGPAERCQDILKEVEKIQTKYAPLDGGGSLLLRGKFVFEDLVKNFGSIRGDLQETTSALAIFHCMLTGGAVLEVVEDNQKELLQSLKEQSDIVKILVTRYEEFQKGTRDEPAFSQVARTAKQEDQEQQTIQAAEKDLTAEGIDKQFILKHQDTIKEWLGVVILAPTNDNGDEDDSTTVADGPTLKRSESLCTHRSKDEDWEPEEATGMTDYAATMIAKVLRSKYSAREGREAFRLPIARAFRSLDFTQRDWIPLVQAEKLCTEASAKLKWTFNDAAIAKIVKAEDEKEGRPNHRIELQELINIVLAVRSEIYEAMKNSSSKDGLFGAAMVLKVWYVSGSRPTMLSPRWSIRNSFELRDQNRKDEFVQRQIFHHQFAGKIPINHAPWALNWTNAIYLATRYCIPCINTTSSNWRPLLQNWSAEDRIEVFEALNLLLETATNFHSLESSHQEVATHHWLDELTERITLIPTATPPEAAPLPMCAAVLTGTWFILRGLLSCITDFSMIIKPGFPGTRLCLNTWRERRILERAQGLKSDALFAKTAEVFKSANAWREKHQDVLDQVEELVQCTLTLRREQELASELNSQRELDIEHFKVKGLSRSMFRKPNTFLKVFVDNDCERTPKVVPDDTSPRFFVSSTYHVNRSSKLRFELHESTKSKYNWDEEPESKSMLCSLEISVQDVADFERRVPVNVEKTVLCAGTQKGNRITMSFTVVPRDRPIMMPRPVRKAQQNAEPSWSIAETSSDKAYREDKEQGLAQYIVTHPLPSDWEPRRNLDDGVYFFNKSTSKQTAVLWYDPCYSIDPEWDLQPLPSDQGRVVEAGAIKFAQKYGGTYTDLESLPQSKEPKIFKGVLKARKYHQSKEFNVND